VVRVGLGRRVAPQVEDLDILKPVAIQMSPELRQNFFWCLVGGDINGATLAGIFTVTGFGALGKHPRNILPIMIGVFLICFPKVWSHADPGPLLAALFCTTLAPLAGKFGFLAGLLAGVLHLPMVMHVGSMHGYMNLYNNGFAGGLAMLIIIGFIKGLWPQLLEDEDTVS